MPEKIIDIKEGACILSPQSLFNTQGIDTLMSENKSGTTLLIEQVAAGSSVAFTQLYEQYQPLVHQYIAKFLNFQQPDIEEVAQVVFLNVWKKRTALSAIIHFEKYLYVMSRNALTDFCRKRKRLMEKQISLNANTQAMALPDYPPDEILLSKEYITIAKEALNELPEKRKIIFELRTQKDLSLEQISAVIGMSVAGVHQNIKKATVFISDYLKKNGLHINILLFLFGMQLLTQA